MQDYLMIINLYSEELVFKILGYNLSFLNDE